MHLLRFARLDAEGDERLGIGRPAQHAVLEPFATVFTERKIVVAVGCADDDVVILDRGGPFAVWRAGTAAAARAEASASAAKAALGLTGRIDAFGVGWWAAIFQRRQFIGLKIAAPVFAAGAKFQRVVGRFELQRFEREAI